MIITIVITILQYIYASRAGDEPGLRDLAKCYLNRLNIVYVYIYICMYTYIYIYIHTTHMI